MKLMNCLIPVAFTPVSHALKIWALNFRNLVLQAGRESDHSRPATLTLLRRER